MAAVGAALPARRLAARDPLARHPPAPDFFRLRRVLEVEDHHDVAAIAVVPLTTTWPPTGQSKYPTCRMPRACVMTPSSARKDSARRPEYNVGRETTCARVRYGRRRSRAGFHQGGLSRGVG